MFRLAGVIQQPLEPQSQRNHDCRIIFIWRLHLGLICYRLAYWYELILSEPLNRRPVGLGVVVPGLLPKDVPRAQIYGSRAVYSIGGWFSSIRKYHLGFTTILMED